MGVRDSPRIGLLLNPHRFPISLVGIRSWIMVGGVRTCFSILCLPCETPWEMDLQKSNSFPGLIPTSQLSIQKNTLNFLEQKL